MTSPLRPEPGAAAPGDAGLPADAVEVARVVGAWGIQGGIKVKPLSAEPQALFSSKRWYLEAPQAPSVRAAPAGRNATAGARAPLLTWPRLLRVRHAREHGAHVLANVEDVTDRDAAQALAGCRVFVSRASFPSTSSDEFYWVDLIGLAVRNREGVLLGEIVGLMQTGPVSVLRVSLPGQRPRDETLIPFVAAYVDQVDLAARCVHVDWQADD